MSIWKELSEGQEDDYPMDCLLPRAGLLEIPISIAKMRGRKSC